MKSILVLIILFVLWVSPGRGQTEPCATPNPVGLPYSLASATAGISNVENEPWVEVLLQFHIIRRTNGTGGLVPDSVARIVTGLNNAFEGAHISGVYPVLWTQS